MNNANFVAIDFETATPKRMPCQLGIAVVKNGEIVETKSFLIQPPGNKYSPMCMAVHGITPKDTENKPTFDLLWNEIKQYIDSNFIVAHNAAFDIDVLKKVLAYYNIEQPRIMGYDCTYQLTGLSLDKACKEYDIKLEQHHEATCDACACAKIFLKYLEGYTVSVNNETKECVKENNSNNDTLSFIDESKINSLSLSEISYNNPLYKQRVLITGITSFDREKAYRILKGLGAFKSSGVNTKLNMIIIGESAGPAKIKELQHLADLGYEIKVYSDESFVEYITQIYKSFING